MRTSRPACGSRRWRERTTGSQASEWFPRIEAAAVRSISALVIAFCCCTLRCWVTWGLTFDMRGGTKGAKRPLCRPLDGRVRRRHLVVVLAPDGECDHEPKPRSCHKHSCKDCADDVCSGSRGNR